MKNGSVTVALTRPRPYKTAMNLLPDFLAFTQIILIDIAMSADNAIAVGMAASGLPAEGRHRAVIAGIIAATGLRILFAIFAVELLHITGLLVAGGLLLLWVTWKMYRDIQHMQRMKHHGAASQDSLQKQAPKTLSSAIIQIVIADVSMSLDNVLAVAGVARDQIWILISGLVLSVLLMGMASALVARLTSRHTWVAYLGLAIVFYTALHMMWDGAHQLNIKL